MSHDEALVRNWIEESKCRPEIESNIKVRIKNGEELIAKYTKYAEDKRKRVYLDKDENIVEGVTHWKPWRKKK